MAVPLPFKICDSRAACLRSSAAGGGPDRRPPIRRDLFLPFVDGHLSAINCGAHPTAIVDREGRPGIARRIARYIVPVGTHEPPVVEVIWLFVDEREL
jgi:hypothetical protein